jgi:hypothetical protein
VGSFDELFGISQVESWAGFVGFHVETSLLEVCFGYGSFWDGDLSLVRGCRRAVVVVPDWCCFRGLGSTLFC